MTVTLRPATPDDAAACATLMRAWIEETDWIPQLHTPEEDRAFVGGKIAAGRVTVAERDGSFAGFMTLEEGYLGQLHVADAHRSRGIGAQLLRHAKVTSPDGFELWTFQANPGALRFYLREGLTELRRTDGAGNEERLPDIRLAWTGKGASS